MLRAPLVLAAFFTALVTPTLAAAGVASIRVSDVRAADRVLAAGSRSAPFQLAGVHWRGYGTVELRTQDTAGRWTAWWPATEDDDGPAPTGWRIGAPRWVGAAMRAEVRSRGPVSRIRLYTVRSPEVRVPLRMTAAARVPAIVLRSAWLADETIRRGDPDIAPELRMAHVHHTAGTNTYTRVQAPAVVRAIQLYHVKANGWNDIGYNALVDRFGTVYEGRHGGTDTNVVGAHARGFNTGSFGIALMGDFRSTAPSKPALDALVRTLAWRLDRAHVDPLGTFTAASSGNERFAPGVPVFLRSISAHRDTGLTTCPGERLYDLLPSIAGRVAVTGLPKLYTPRVERDEAGALRFTARLSGPVPWTVVVTDPAGAELVREEGIGPTLDWAWETSPDLPAGARWRIEATGATAAEGIFSAEVAGTLALVAPKATPTVISPNADGQADSTDIGFTLSVDATITAVVLDETGAQVAELERSRWRRQGARTLAFTGAELPDGRYVVSLTARATGGRTATAEIPVTISRTLGKVTLSSAVLVPARAPLTIGFTLGAPAAVRVTLARGGRWVATLLDETLEPGARVIPWNGSKGSRPARDGDYIVTVQATDGVGSSRIESSLTLDGTPPVLRVVSASPPRLWVSEPAVVTMLVNNARRKLELAAPGTFRIPRVERLRTLVATARDRVGNASPRLTRP